MKNFLQETENAGSFKGENEKHGQFLGARTRDADSSEGEDDADALRITRGTHDCLGRTGN